MIKTGLFDTIGALVYQPDETLLLIIRGVAGRNTEILDGAWRASHLSSLRTVLEKDARMNEQGVSRQPLAEQSVLVWDVPTRIFHWLLVALIVASLVTGNVGGLTFMRIHMLSGYAILALILFRVIWGFIGNTHARFSNFVAGPLTAIGYARGLVSGSGRAYLGHNPLGGWSVLVMLVLMLVQAATGLCANDDIFTEGPLAGRVGKATSDFLTGIHQTNANLLYVVMAVHVIAVLGYLFKGDNLIRPMITGRKRVADSAADREAPGRYAVRALIAIAISVAIVVGVVNL